MSRRGQPAAPSSLLANLASSPFVNKRPVQRFAAVAWMVGALLTGINVALWVQYRHESTTLRERLAETRAAIDRKSRNVVEMDEQLRGLRLGAQNAQVKFLNDRIAERTFPWSLLFERIATTLPDGVRLRSLTPVFVDGDDVKRDQKRDRPLPTPGDELVSLKINGAAKTDDSLYELVDSFFASPAFAHPRLFQESTSAAEVEFTIDVDYRPRFTGDDSHQPAAAREADAAGEEGAGGESAEGAAAEESAAEGSAAENAAVEPAIVEVSE
jgi:Tfp pilus assembly protein PilN